MIKSILSVAALSAVSVTAFAGAPASADNGHFYAGAQAGYVRQYELSQSDFDSSQVAGTAQTLRQTSDATNNFGARVKFGYMFNQYVGLELGAGTFGSRNLTLDQYAVAPGDITSSSTPERTLVYKVAVPVAFDADVVGALPLSDKVSVFAGAGAAMVDVTYKADASKSTAGVVDTTTGVSNIGPYTNVPNKTRNWAVVPRAELGLSYQFADNMAVTASYQHYFGRGKVAYSTDSANTDAKDAVNVKKYVPSFGMAAIGLTYSF